MKTLTQIKIPVRLDEDRLIWRKGRKKILCSEFAKDHIGIPGRVDRATLYVIREPKGNIWLRKGDSLLLWSFARPVFFDGAMYLLMYGALQNYLLPLFQKYEREIQVSVYMEWEE